MGSRFFFEELPQARLAKRTGQLANRGVDEPAAGTVGAPRHNALEEPERLFRKTDVHPSMYRACGLHGRRTVHTPCVYRQVVRGDGTGAVVIDSDPAVEAAAVDAGYVLGEATLRAPDVSVGAMDDGPGFATGAPALAIEYVERGDDEADLERKIAQLLGASTAIVWVVRLGGERGVEVHRGGEAVRVKRGGEDLLAPGILRNPVPVDAPYDRTVAHEVTLRNLLQRRGYASLEDVRRDAALEHARTRLRRTLELRRIAVSAERERSIASCADLAELELWLDRALVATTAEAVLRGRAVRHRCEP